MDRFKKYIIIFLAILFLIGFMIYYYFFNNNLDDESVFIEDDITSSVISECIGKNIFVDVKGAVKNPGVYELKDNDKVIDAINKAGGLTKNAVTSNINLSKFLSNEMVIYVFTKSEMKKSTTTINTNVDCKCETIVVDNCIKEDDNDKELSSNNNKININTASKEELMTISGIGESKALSIINYRNENGNFKSIEDIKNVSGFGDSIYEKIKDYITV